MYCSGCGASLDAPKSFCPSCGQSLIGGEASAKAGAIRPPNTGHSRLTLVVAFIVLGAAAVVAVVVRAFAPASTSSPGVTYYKTIAEVRAMRGNAVDTPLRVGGAVQRGSVQRNGRNVRFVLYADALQMQVVYDGADPLPGAFREAATVLVSGKLGRDDVFHASKVGVSNFEFEPAPPPKPELFIRAEELFDQYQQNEVKADQLYRGATLRFTGTSGASAKTFLTTPISPFVWAIPF
jgi:cytochrome c-type biogenesis protein CcmE